MHTPRFEKSIAGAESAAKDLAAASNMLGEFAKLLRETLALRSYFPLLGKQIEYTLETAAKHGFILHPAPDYSALAALRELQPPAISVKTIMENLRQPEGPRPNTGILPPRANVGQGPRHAAPHPTGYCTHRVRYSDSSFYDQKCVLCGVTDRREGDLDKTCTGSQADRDAFDAAVAERAREKADAMIDSNQTVMMPQHPIEDAFDAGRALAIERAEKAAAQREVAVDKLKIVNSIVNRLRGDKRLPHVSNDHDWQMLKPLRWRLSDVLLDDIDKAVQAVDRPTHQNWFAGRVLQSVTPFDRDNAWLKLTSTDVFDMVHRAFAQVISEVKENNA